MASPRKSSTFHWLFCVGILLLGGGILGLYVFNRLSGTTPDNELTFAEGVAEDVILSQGAGRAGSTFYLHFSVGPYRTVYTSDQPKYWEVESAVQSRKPIRVWVSMRQETLFPRQGWVPLYKLSVGDRPVLTYSEAVAQKAGRSGALLLGGVVLSAIGAWGVYVCIRNLRRYSAAVSAGVEAGSSAKHFDGTQSQMKRVTWMAISLSIVFYAIVIGTNFGSQVRAKQVEAFGAEPLGMPVVLVVSFVETLLFLPIPWVVWHGLRLAVQARQDGRRFGIVYLLRVGRFHPHLRRSQLACAVGLLYCFLICGGWIVFAAVRGI
jgi:hypothetical protein